MIHFPPFLCDHLIIDRFNLHKDAELSLFVIIPVTASTSRGKRNYLRSSPEAIDNAIGVNSRFRVGFGVIPNVKSDECEME
jgi:hypothetical protein